MNRNGIPDRLFRHHGHWASKKCDLDGYVRDDFNSRLSVMQSLGT